MHVSLPVGSTVLMGSDSTSAFGPPPTAGDNFAISVKRRKQGAVRRPVCQAVRGRGTVTTPPQEMFWGAYFGCWTGPVRHQVDGQLRVGRPNPKGCGR